MKFPMSIAPTSAEDLLLAQFRVLQSIAHNTTKSVQQIFNTHAVIKDKF